ncbi:hypothetical protein PR001_g28227 [Phytophthora rubi]|uniref:Uncharacterized protein n=1 Tax=Phytophthora rubi TaxID=129364 RepID=A0A6A3HDX7_9STRA|nr:hypothetical protein PR001_g28227 [Phytophthora rubi]
MEQTECKRRIQAALLSKAFPPQIIFPEAQQQLDVLAPLAGLFGRPIVVWVPECREAGQKPQCISPGCLCTPRLKEYKHRVVQDVESKVELLYIKYQCTGADRRCFSTVSQAYLQRSVETLLHFPYLTSHKTGYAKNLMEMVHDGITSPSGLAKMMDNIRRRRQVRYYKLYTLFSDRLQRLRRSNPAYLTISPPSCDLYCQNNAVPTEQVMTAVWLETTEAALLSRGSLPESPQLAFALHILSEPLDQPQYRSASSTDFSFAQWQRMFDSVHVDSSNVDATLSAPQNHFQSVKELLMKSATSVVTNRLPKHAFLASLSLDANSYEPAAGFTSQEYELLRQIRAEQEREECQWSKCLLITTIMYNLVVANNPNTALALQRRSYATIVSKLASLSARKSEAKPSSSRRVNLFALHQNRPVTSATTAYERSFLEQLFDALRGSRLFKGKKKLFCKVYDFASRVCDGIFPKEEAILTRKWGSLKRSSNRFTSLKIKLKLPPQQSTSPTATVVTDSASAPTAAIAVGVSSCTSDARSLPNQKQISSACDRGQSLLRDSAKEFGHGGTPIEESASQLLKSQLLAAGFDPASGEGTAQQFLVASTPSAEPLTPADSSHRQHSPEIMTDEDVSFFLSMAESTPRDPQKWKLIHAKYIERFPSSLRTPNALRCKLAKEKRRRVPEVVTLAPLPSKKSRTSSCESCRRKKKRCGVGSINPSCARAPLQSSRALDDYFSGA